MKLPDREAAVVPKEKITDYLLSSAHRDGRHKAAFFFAFGFAKEDYDVLVSALLRHANDHDVAKKENSPFGVRYIIECVLNTPDVRNPCVRSVWFIENHEETPRLVTAYPV